MFTPEEVKEGLTSAQAKEYGKKSVQFLRRKPNSCFVSIVDYTFKDGKKGSLFMAGTELECKSLYVALKRNMDEKQLAMGSATLKIEKGKDEALEIDRTKGKASLKKLERQNNKIALSATTVECKVKGSEEEPDEVGGESLKWGASQIDSKVDDSDLLSKKERVELSREESPNVQAKMNDKERTELKARLQKLMTQASELVKTVNKGVADLRAADQGMREIQKQSPEDQATPTLQKALEDCKTLRKQAVEALTKAVDAWDSVYDQIEDSGEVKLKEQLAEANEFVERVKSKLNIKPQAPPTGGLANPANDNPDDLRRRAEQAFDEGVPSLNEVIRRIVEKQTKENVESAFVRPSDKDRIVRQVLEEKAQGKRTFSSILASLGALRLRDKIALDPKRSVTILTNEAKLKSIGQKYGLE